MKLYTYWRSTSSYRVRIALALKGIQVEQVPIHLVRNGGEQHTSHYREINPQGRVPALQLDDGTVITQSPAILEYLDEVYPNPSLLPSEPLERAKVRAVAAIAGCDIHALHNLGPLNYLRHTLGRGEAEISAWTANWISPGLAAIESKLGENGYAFGPEPSLADVYLLPQLYAARRFEVPLAAFPKILRVEALASKHAAFIKAHPSSQPDAE